MTANNPTTTEDDAIHVATPIQFDEPTAAGVGAALATHLGEAALVALGPEDPSNPGVLSVPSARRLVSMKRYHDQYRKAPERREGSASFTDLASFVAHANRFKDPHSALFAVADPKSPKLTSVLNYHESGQGSPRFGDHRGVYVCPLSEQWTAWTAANGKQMDQAAFAAFIEDRLPDVADPENAFAASLAFAVKLGLSYASPAKLLTTSRGLAIRETAQVQNAVKLDTGETAFAYVTTHETKEGGPLTVPSSFLIEVPVFQNGAPYQLAVRLRYRLRDGRVTWFFELYRASEAFDHAFAEACSTAASETALPLFFGTPE